MLLALEQRKNEDQRTLCELFFFECNGILYILLCSEIVALVDEMADVTFSNSLEIIMVAMIASLQELLRLSDAQLDEFTKDFTDRLPDYLKNVLNKTALAA